jgi:hypothetical protein
VSGHEINQCRLLPVVLAIRDFLALFEHVSPRRYRAGAAGRGKQSRRMRDDDVVMKEVGRS